MIKCLNDLHIICIKTIYLTYYYVKHNYIKNEL